jgi:hypothetical protein
MSGEPGTQRNCSGNELISEFVCHQCLRDSVECDYCSLRFASCRCDPVVAAQSTGLPFPVDADAPRASPELPALTEEELTTPSWEYTVTEDPSGMLVEPASPSVLEVTLEEGGQFAPLQLLDVARRLSCALGPVEACVSEPLATAAEEELLAVAAQGSLCCCTAS